MNTLIRYFITGVGALLALTASAQTNLVYATNTMQVTQVNIIQALSQTNITPQSASPTVVAAIAEKSLSAVATNIIVPSSLNVQGALPSVQGELVSFSELGVTGRTGMVTRATAVPEAKIAVKRADGSIDWVSSETAKNLLSSGEAASPLINEVSVSQNLETRTPGTFRATPRAYSPQIVAESTALGLTPTGSWQENFEDPDSEQWVLYASDNSKAAVRTSNANSGHHALLLEAGEQVQSPFIPTGPRRSIAVLAYLSGQASIFVEEYSENKQLILTHETKDYQTTDYQKCGHRFERAPETVFIRIVISNTGTSELGVDDLLVY